MLQRTAPVSLVPTQVPEFVVTDGQKFIEFIQKYYEFMVEYSPQIEKLRDIDNTSEATMRLLLKEYAARFPKSRIQPNQLIRAIRDVYLAKGTEKAFRLLYRLFFNSEIIFSQPSKNILRASDGKWIQERQFSLRTVFSTIPSFVGAIFTIENDTGKYFIEPSRVEVTNDLVNVHFDSYSLVQLDELQFADIYDDFGTLLYKGEIVKTPSNIEVVQPGKNWNVGQLIVIQPDDPTGTPTIGKVTTVGPAGELLSVDIVEFGGPHPEDATVLVSPFKTKPNSASIDIITEISSLDVNGNPIYEYTINILDKIPNFDERIVGVGSIIGADSYGQYFNDPLNDYFAQDYNGKQLIRQSVQFVASNTAQESVGGVDYNEWFSSQAVIILRSNYLVKNPGKFADDSSKLSNQEIRLQDNYYYQLFSYVIETTVNAQLSSDVVSMIHPAGTKRFTNLVRSVEIEPSYDAYRYISKNKISFTLDAVASDSIALHPGILADADYVSSTDLVNSVNPSKRLAEDLLFDDSTRRFDVTSFLEQQVATATEIIAKSGTKIPTTDVASADDAIPVLGSSLVKDEDPAVGDAHVYYYTKVTDEIVDVFGDVVEITSETYVDSTYVDEDYLDDGWSVNITP